MVTGDALFDELTPEARLALAYAPASARAACLGLLALDGRLARIVRTSREPLLAQIKLAWWREQLGRDPEARARGEPLIAVLGDWGAAPEALLALIDGWEASLAQPENDGFARLIAARGEGWAALAERIGCGNAREAARQAGKGWALAELGGAGSAANGARPALLAGADWHRVGLPRALRPLAVLHGLARRSRGKGPLLPGPAAFAVAIRLGLCGR